MGIFNFLKKKKTIKKEYKEIIFNEIPNWIKEKEKQIRKKEEEIFNLIKERITILSKELKEKIEILKKVDIKSKKNEEKINILIEENKKDYINNLKDFIEKLEELDKKNIKDFINEINGIFSNFEKRSYLNYQKANLLIGKEITTIKKTIILFSNYLKEIFEENKPIIKLIKTVDTLKIDLKETKKIDENNQEIHTKKKLINNKINETLKNKDNLSKEIENFKQSKEYKEYIYGKNKIEEDKKRLENEINELKKMINFKELGNIFHINKKEMETLKKYKENFQENFNKDYGKSIFNLVKESKQNTENISKQMKKIKEINESIKIKQKNQKKDKIEIMLHELKKINLEIENLNNEKNYLTKISEKLEKNKQKLIDSIKQRLLKEKIKLKI